MTAAEFYIEVAKGEYLAGRWTLEEFEATVDVVLRGGAQYLQEKLDELRTDLARLGIRVA